MPPKPEEIKNFDLESRMREVAAECIEPVIRMLADSLEQILRLEKKSETYKKQLADLENVCSRTDRSLLQLKEFSKRFGMVEDDLRSIESEHLRKSSELEVRLDNMEITIERMGKLLEQLESRNGFLDSQLSSVHELITEHKEATAKRVQVMQRAVDVKVDELVKASSVTDRAARESSQKLGEMMKLSPLLTSQVETMKTIVSDCEAEVLRMKRGKLEDKDLVPLRKELQIEIGKLKGAVYQGELRQDLCEGFVEKYVPVTLHACLSDALHVALGNSALRRYAAYEVGRVGDLKSQLSTRQTSCEDIKQNLRETLSKIELRAHQPEFREHQPKQCGETGQSELLEIVDAPQSQPQDALQEEASEVGTRPEVNSDLLEESSATSELA
jgi:TolA-binding protein